MESILEFILKGVSWALAAFLTLTIGGAFIYVMLYSLLWHYGGEVWKSLVH